MIQNKLLNENDLIDSEIMEGVKALKRNGFDIESIENLFIQRLKVTGRSEYIPFLRSQIKIIKA